MAAWFFLFCFFFKQMPISILKRDKSLWSVPSSWKLRQMGSWIITGLVSQGCSHTWRQIESGMIHTKEGFARIAGSVSSFVLRTRSGCRPPPSHTLWPQSLFALAAWLPLLVGVWEGMGSSSSSLSWCGAHLALTRIHAPPLGDTGQTAPASPQLWELRMANRGSGQL